MPVSVFFAAWLACLIPAIACAIEMFLAGTFPLAEGLVAMGIYHAIIGVIEGFVTVAAVYLITTARPDLVDTGVTAPAGA
jgi:cobalt/nickel transport system permease protein